MSELTLPWIRRLRYLVLLIAVPLGCSKNSASQPHGPALADSAPADSAILPSSDAGSANADSAPADSAILPSSDASFADAESADASTAFSRWRDCGDYDATVPSTAPRADCLCLGVNACDAVFGISWLPTGSERFRVCGKANGECRVAIFSETEGGGTGRICNIPLGTKVCATAPVKTQDLLGKCETRFTCNLVQATCPADLLRCD